MTVTTDAPAVSAPIEKRSPRRVLILIAIFLGIAIAGATRAKAAGSGNHVATYLSVIAMEWLLAWYALKLARKDGFRLRDWLPSYRSWRELALDVLVAAAFFFVAQFVLDGVKQLLGPSDAYGVQWLLPRNALEAALWIPVALSAGFCEEVVFRGYIQSQLALLTKSRAAAVLLQSIVFGIAHGYQGWQSLMTTGVYGLLFGIVAAWRGTLRPGIGTHAVQDLIGGLR